MDTQAVPPLKDLLQSFFNAADSSANVCDEVINTIEGATQISEDVKTAEQLAAEAQQITTPATPVLKDATLIPAEPLPALKPVADAVGVIDTTLKRTVTPSLKTVVAILSGLIVLLLPILTLLKRHREKNGPLHTSFHNALSVSQQIEEKYGGKPPPAIQSETAALSAALTTASPALSKLEGVVQSVQSGIKPLSAIHGLNQASNKLMSILKPMQSVLKSVLNKSGKLLKALNKAITAFDRYKDLALSKIKAFLKQGGIDLSFVTTLQNKIKDAENKVIHEVTQPVRDIEEKAKSELSKLNGPINQLNKITADFDDNFTACFSPLHKLLDQYVNAAAKIGFHPR